MIPCIRALLFPSCWFSYVLCVLYACIKQTRKHTHNSHFHLTRHGHFCNKDDRWRRMDWEWMAGPYRFSPRCQVLTNQPHQEGLERQSPDPPSEKFRFRRLTTGSRSLCHREAPRSLCPWWRPRWESAPCHYRVKWHKIITRVCPAKRRTGTLKSHTHAAPLATATAWSLWCSVFQSVKWGWMNTYRPSTQSTEDKVHTLCGTVPGTQLSMDGSCISGCGHCHHHGNDFLRKPVHPPQGEGATIGLSPALYFPLSTASHIPLI